MYFDELYMYFVRHIHRHWVVASRTLWTFSFSEYWQTIFHSAYTRLDSHIIWEFISPSTLGNACVLLYISHICYIFAILVRIVSYFFALFFIFLMMNEILYAFLIMGNLNGLYLKYMPKSLANFLWVVIVYLK